jgi:histidine triad (HIT) family protein
MTSPDDSASASNASDEVVSGCIFCRIVAGELPATIVAQTDRSVAFRDLDPKAPTHVLVVPRRHVPNVAALAAYADELADVIATASQVASDEGVADSGYRLVFNTGPDAQQTVFHVHGHVLAGRAFTWPPG